MPVLPGLSKIHSGYYKYFFKQLIFILKYRVKFGGLAAPLFSDQEEEMEQVKLFSEIKLCQKFYLNGIGGDKVLQKLSKNTAYEVGTCKLIMLKKNEHVRIK